MRKVVSSFHEWEENNQPELRNFKWKFLIGTGVVVAIGSAVSISEIFREFVPVDYLLGFDGAVFVLAVIALFYTLYEIARYDLT